MTKQEVIEILNFMSGMLSAYSLLTQQRKDALGLAIEALKKDASDGSVSAVGLCPRCEDLATLNVELGRRWTSACCDIETAEEALKAMEQKIYGPEPAPEPKTLDEKIELACNKYPDLRELFEE